MLPEWLVAIELQEAEQEQALAEQEIAELEAQLRTSLARQAAIRDHSVPPRSRSRRATTRAEIRAEALMEIDAYIATLQLKLDQRRRRLQVAQARIQSIRH